MFRYSISFIFLLVYSLGYAQEKAMEVPAIEKDTLVYKTAYGLRLGADISKPILAAFNGNYTGFELVADYRIGKKIYLATEIGFEEKTSIEDYSNSTSKGNYIRVGFNYNAYDNWLDILEIVRKSQKEIYRKSEGNDWKSMEVNAINERYRKIN